MRSFAAAKVVAGGILLGLVATATGPAAPPPAPSTELVAAATSRTVVLDNARSALLELADKSSKSDTQYLSGGRFRYVGTPCPRCELGPAVAAAAYYRRTGEVTFYKIAVSAMDTAIKQQKKDGSFATGAPGEGDNTIQTVFFTQHLGSMMSFLGPKLDLKRRAVYKAALIRSADAVVARGLLTYYVNGNINSSVTVGQGMAWKITGQPRFKSSYEKSLAFTTRPSGSRWKGYGFKATKVGALSVGRNTRGYLAEKGAGDPGFDPEYTMFAADLLSEGYLVLRDPRLLTLSNSLLNQLWSRVDTDNWTYDITGGSRHARTTGRDRFTTGALIVGARFGRADLEPLVQSQARATALLMRDSSVNAWPGIYQAWGSQMATLIFTI